MVEAGPSVGRNVRLRVAFVGCGAIAHAHAQAIGDVPALELAALVDPDPNARRALAGDGALPAFADVEALLAADLPLDGALVLTPPAHHETLACRLLGAGLHVLCEKPLAPTEAAAERMFAAAHAADRRLVLAGKFRHVADVAAARALLTEGRIGALVRYENVFTGRAAMAGRWQADPVQSGGGVLMDNGSHVADLATALLGPLARVQATFAPPAPGLAVEDTVHLQFTSQGGVLGTADLSWRTHVEAPYVRLSGERGAIELGWRGARWRQDDGAWQTFGSGYDKRAAFAGVLAGFARTCAEGPAPGGGEAHARAAVAFVAAAYRSAAAGRAVELAGEAPPSRA